MENLQYLVVAFALAWVVLLGYVLLLSRRQTKVEAYVRYLDELVQQREGRESTK